MDSIFTIINSENVTIEKGLVYVNNKSIGLICPTVLEGFTDDKITHIFGPKGISEILDYNPEKILESLIDVGAIIFGATEDEVLLSKKYIDDPVYSRTFSYISSSVKNCSELNQAMNYIINAKVAIIGCGGIGSISAILLAGAGIKNLTLIDGDTIEKSNLNRQILWNKNDIGKFKIDVLNKVINDRFDGINCQLIFEKISENMKLNTNFDIIIVTADEPLSLYKNLMESNKHLPPTNFIGSGYVQNNLTLTIGNLYKNHETKDNFFWKRNPFFIGPSFGPSNIELAGIISSFALNKIAHNSNVSSFSSIWDSTKFPREILSV
ncbi:ThiF family adenylyltransferase [Acinetobacter piscicola]|uniref:ThiF family adenylyltransferase n=1 Tax=Acinetobacter piscicola TaxID=2006115 RepID=UPI000B7EA03A|nr:ThiF family adenylyltransferase [Acinetobacter piscicola]